MIHPLADEYAKKHSSTLDNLLQEIEQKTRAEHAHAHMISGSIQGKLLELITKMISPVKILEIGTFTGFSAICLANGLAPDGILHTIEIRPADAELAWLNFNKANMQNKIKLHIGNALDIIPTLKENWDLVFIDADKINYINYYELTLPYLRKGGFMVIDNVLFHGQVLEEEIKGKNAKAMDSFNKHLSQDNRVENVMLTVRDGITIVRKL